MATELNVDLPGARGKSLADVFVLGTLHFALLDQNSVQEVLDAYFAAGGRWIDTSPFYGRGRVEKALGSYFRRTRPPVRISAKVGHFHEPGQYVSFRAVTDSLRHTVDTLGVKPEVASLHEGDWAIWWGAASSPGVPLTPTDKIQQDVPAWEALKVFAEEIDARCGLTGNNAHPLMTAAMAVQCDQVMVAKQYDLLWRSAEPLLTWAGQSGVRVWCAAPFHQGALLDLPSLRNAAVAARDLDFAHGIEALDSLLRRAGERTEHAALPFLLADERVSAVVVGVRSVRELRSAFASAARPLHPAFLSSLRQLGIVRPPRPGVASRPEYQ